MKQTNKTTTKHINIIILEAKTQLGLKIQTENYDVLNYLKQEQDMYAN